MLSRRHGFGLIACALMLATIVFVCCVSANEPEIAWSKTFGGSGDDLALSVQQTTDDGYILAGFTLYYNEVNVNTDSWLIKTDLDGDVEWNKTFGGTGRDEVHSVQQTADGGYILAGYTNTRGTGVYYFDAWLVKTDSNGNEEWNRTFGGIRGLDDFAYSVQQTSDGGYILAGETQSFREGGGQDFWLIKTDTDGNKQWEKTFGRTGPFGCRAYSAQQTTDGGYILVGNSLLAVSGGATHTSIWLVKTNSTGDEQWNKDFGRPGGDDYAETVLQTSDGGYIIAGAMESSETVQNVFLLIKTDGDGNEEWSKTYGEPGHIRGRSIQQTADAGYIFTGTTYGTLGYDAWLVKIDSNGDEQWNKTFGGTGDDYAESVQQTADGGYILAGSTHGDAWLIKVGGEQTSASAIRIGKEKKEAPSVAETETPSGEVPEEKGLPGFDAICALVGLLAVAHIVMRRR